MLMNKKIIVLQLLFSCCFFSAKAAVYALDPGYSSTPPTANDSSSKKWIDQFKIFRDALYRQDFAAVKKMMHFPVMNTGNEIWYLVLTEKELKRKNLSAKLVPFTEHDFDRYHARLFPKEFTKALLKIKSAQLYASHAAATDPFTDASGRVIQLYANVDAANNIVTFNLNYTIPAGKDDSDRSESSIIYSFKLTGQEMIFVSVQLAG